MTNRKLKVLLVPDSIQWITGTMCKNIAQSNPWIEAAIVSGPVLDEVFGNAPETIHNYDLVHFLCQYSSKEWMPKFRENAPVVTTHHHVADWELDKHNMDGDAIMVVAKEWLEDLRSRDVTMEKVFLYSNGVDTEKFRPPSASQRQSLRRELGIPTQNSVVGFFAKKGSNNHNDRKGTDVFAKAAELLTRQRQDVSFLIIGPGWQDLVDRLRVAGGHCVWIPFVNDNSGVARMYHALDFYWVTSRVEGGPVPLLEAMSSEVCCLATPVGLVPEIGSNHQNVIIVPFDSPQTFADQTTELIEDSMRRHSIGQSARQTIVTKKDLAITTPAVVAGYDMAFDSFSRRTSTPRSEFPNVDSIAVQYSKSPITNRTEKNALNGIPKSLHRRVAMLENIHWGETLLTQNQRREGLRWLRQECFMHPFALQAWRMYLRRALPAKLASALIQVKRQVQAK